MLLSLLGRRKNVIRPWDPPKIKSVEARLNTGDYSPTYKRGDIYGISPGPERGATLQIQGNLIEKGERDNRLSDSVPERLVGNHIGVRDP